ncbi:MAG: ABC transporter substrate-binding protein [Pseudomonadota bacterium]
MTANRLVLTIIGWGIASAACVGNAACPATQPDISKVVVSGGSLTEIIYALGAESSIVAVDRTSNYPAAARALPQIGYVRALSAEGVLSAQPTLVLGEDDTGPPEVVTQLEKAGVPIAIVEEAHDAAGIVEKVRCVGQVMGLQDLAEAYIAEALMPAVAALESTASSSEPITGVVLLGVRDGLLIAAGADTSGDGLLQMMAAENALAAVNGWKPVSVESMLAADPEFLVIPQRGLDAAGGVDGLVDHPTLKFTRAAREGRIYAMDGMAMLGFGPRTLDAAARLSQEVRKPSTSDADNER